MRTLLIAAFGLMLGTAAIPADAQRIGNVQGGYRGDATIYRPNPGPVRPGPVVGPVRPGPVVGPVRPGPVRTGNPGPSRTQRWGGQVGGRWYGGSRAPGGWNAYRRPSRGWTLPRYWIAPSFYINDFSSYGLSSPPRGYSWSRYYDDAVLMDSRGQVWDSVSGLDWDRYDDGYAGGGYGYGAGGGGGYAGYGYAEGGAGGSAGGGYVQPGYRPAPPPSYGAPYGQPDYREPPLVYAPPAEVVQDGYAEDYAGSEYTDSGQYSGAQTSGGYVRGGYWYPPVTTTTVTVQSAPMVETTTTTEEYIETTTYAAPRTVYRAKRKWKPKPKPRPVVRRQCGCDCACR